jgi:hypothetical protein
MSFWTKIYSLPKVLNLWRQPTRRTNLAEVTYLPYFDQHDNFPLKWHQAISESPSATACVSTIQDFLEGFGFSDPSLEKKIVNGRDETMFQIHQKTCKDFGEFEGFYWHFMFNRQGKITEWSVLPFENCRLGKPDSNGYINKIYYNPYFGTGDYKTIRESTKAYHCYNFKDVQTQIGEEGENYLGQVLFVGTTNALSRFYPLPEAHSSYDWMRAEAGVADYHNDNINNGLLQPYMLIMKGDPNEPVRNPDASSTEEPQTQAQAFDEIVSSNFMGAKRVGNAWVHWVQNPDEKPEVLTFPSNNSGDLFVTVDNQCTKKITISFKVPAVLANIHEGVSLGGDGNQIRVAVKLMQQRVIKRQRILTDSYQKILINFYQPYAQEITIAPYNPYPELEVLDDKIWNALSTEEKRDWIEKNTEIELVDPVEPQLTQPTPGTNGQNKITNALPVSFPENVRKSVKKALDYQDKMSLKCSSGGGRMLSEAIINNENLGYRNLKRLYNYLKKNEVQKDRTFMDGCEAVKYAAFGGKEMETFLENELKRFNAWLN